MLKGSLYKVVSLSHLDGTIHASLQINPRHEIFEGHFPGQPVLPGACMLQILKEVLEDTLSRKLQLQKADQLKFIQLIDPHVDNIVELNLSHKITTSNNLYVTGNLTSAGATCFKFQGTFVG